MSPCTMSQFFVNLDESNDLFDFNAVEFNTVPGMSSVNDTSDASKPAAPTPKRRQHFSNLELDKYVEQLSMNKGAKAKQPYNHNNCAKSFLQRLHELAE
ncbi:hypothetical protein E5676_scaffold83G00640 [Cucumis melo var. makuwa]|uniref:CACTA en-spm transposon protein n=1 Tax=Cucumis melo var. makuwa TaxID=1194695 RepID=A0A5D3C4T2_CUCMM|nr:hypothetical protein E6C27_scaffold67G002520 [Cucumis melo var. makuwa]TYK05389.1 hypothetical protein E5676_scaffold83G00640 [Cucumis melo var. makuwa]